MGALGTCGGARPKLHNHAPTGEGPWGTVRLTLVEKLRLSFNRNQSSTAESSGANRT